MALEAAVNNKQQQLGVLRWEKARADDASEPWGEGQGAREGCEGRVRGGDTQGQRQGQLWTRSAKVMAAEQARS